MNRLTRNIVIAFATTLLLAPLVIRAADVPTSSGITLSSSNQFLVDGFAWAKSTALGKVHSENGGCYQAALQDRGGYCQRDFVHQIDGAALLGLHRENLAMLRCFARHQTKVRGWFTLWEINACTYNELPGIVLTESADCLGTQRRAFAAYAHFLHTNGDHSGSQSWIAQAERLKRVFNDTWYDGDAGRFRIGFDHPQRRPVSAFGYETSWFIPYTELCEPGPRATAYLDFIHTSFQAKPSGNIEAWTYLPDVFYAWSQNERGWLYFKHVLDSRSSYPEVSFTVISHIATRIMGIDPDAHGRSMSTLGRLPAEVAWVQLDHVPVGQNDLLIRHEDGNRSTTVANNAGPDIHWQALFPGTHPVILVDGTPITAVASMINGAPVSGVSVALKSGQRRVAALPKP